MVRISKLLPLCTLGLILLGGARLTPAADEKKPAGIPDENWTRIKLDDAFRSEGVAAGDFNKDGKLDVAAGDVWYEAPEWKMHAFRPVGTYKPAEGYSKSFANFAWDINADGWDDIIELGFPGEPFFWYENPQGKPESNDGHWKQHLLWHSGANESPDFEDLDGDGKPELIIGSEPDKQLGYVPLPSPEKARSKWDFTAVNEPGDTGRNGSHRFYHGLGVGDVNGDGRKDVLIRHGWYEAPESRSRDVWKFHPYVLSKDGKGDSLPCANIYALDLDLDGDQDLICSSAHQYGVWWFENVGTAEGQSGPQFKYHLIDESYSQSHAMELVDLNGDGELEFVTGKRYYAHNGKGDPGENEPVVMYWYEIKRQKGQPPQFVAHEIVAGRDTGVGTQFQVRDMNGDGKPDIVLSNKKGTNVLLQKGK